MASVKAWKEGDPGQPKFPADFEVVKKAVLQVTRIESNNNKYYAVEIHVAKSGEYKYRVYTHYGRTDDLEANPNAGMRESRYFKDMASAEGCYADIYKQKTSATKGYKELSLASAKIGSRQTLGKSVGHIDEATLKKLEEKDKGKGKAPSPPKCLLPTMIQELVGYLYEEATKALVTTVNAQITANGIETPLGVLTIGQIDKGQVVLDQLVSEFGKKKPDPKALSLLSGQFYTVIPCRFGRTAAAAQQAILDTADKLNEKQETLQLMRDMLNVNGKTNVLVNPQIEQKYLALKCCIEPVDPQVFQKMKDYFEKSVVRSWPKVAVKNIWKIQRQGEGQAFNSVGNDKLLFHGSNVKNWVGIMSRGLLMPKIVVSLGVHRTDAGWLGNGIYFGDAACTSCGYAGTGRRGTRFVAIATVSLGKVKQYRKITYGLNKPPDGFDSCHGVRGSEFSDNELVIYDSRQQKLEYLVETKG